MSFQLVRASDSEIVVWHVDHGHIFVFQIPPGGSSLLPGPSHEIAGAAESAEAVRDGALRFATEEARKRDLIGRRPKPGYRTASRCGIEA